MHMADTVHLEITAGFPKLSRDVSIGKFSIKANLSINVGSSIQLSKQFGQLSRGFHGIRGLRTS